MLNLYIKPDNRVISSKKEVVTDVEKEFKQLKLQGTEIEKKLIKMIEKGTYLDSISFIDRFGYKLYLEHLSTGCKAALCVVNRPDKIIDLVECGNNARDIIISLLREGNILMEDNSVTFSSIYGQGVDVRVDNYRFSNIDRLNKYVFDERPYGADLNTEGIEKCMQ